MKKYVYEKGIFYVNDERIEKEREKEIPSYIRKKLLEKGGDKNERVAIIID